MQLQQLIKKTEEDITKFNPNTDGEPSKDYILLREGNLWLVENLITKQRQTLTFGDKLEFYNNTECHMATGKWIGTCMGEVTSWNSISVNIGYREKMYNYIMANGTKFYNYYPVKMNLEKAKDNSKIVACVLLAVLTIGVFINLFYWLGMNV